MRFEFYSDAIADVPSFPWTVQSIARFIFRTGLSADIRLLSRLV